jgi:xanthine dehydrogenase YagS FAD-binding subunit
MNPFTYERASDANSAVTAVNRAPNSMFLGGGTNLLDLMKMGTEQPAHLVDITRVPLTEITDRNGGLRIGAMARNSDAAMHPLIRQRYPVLSEAILAGASPQLRNAATMGGNLMQRTRCPYFYDPSFTECNKRAPGSGCAAIPGYNRMHAILGTSPQCIAVHPSDMCVALAALEAIILVTGPHGDRTIAMADFHRLPGATPNIDTNLHPGELIIAIDLPAMPYATHASYLKVRDRNSYAFALVSVAAIIDTDSSGVIRHAHIALGGVAHKPWRVPEAERSLIGKQAGEPSYRTAAAAIVRGARPYPHNAFKVELARRTVVRALTNAASA